MVFLSPAELALRIKGVPAGSKLGALLRYESQRRPAVNKLCIQHLLFRDPVNHFPSRRIPREAFHSAAFFPGRKGFTKKLQL